MKNVSRKDDCFCVISRGGHSGEVYAAVAAPLRSLRETDMFKPEEQIVNSIIAAKS